MMIVLDTNQLDRHSLNSPLMALLKVVSESTNNVLAISAVSYNEHCAHFENRIRRAFSQQEKLRNELYDLVEISRIGGRSPSSSSSESLAREVKSACSAYRARLSGMFRLIELDGASAIEALRREAWRIAPASTSFDTRGSGARDAAIWLSLVRESARLGKAIYFISSDKRAFKANQCVIDTNKASASVVVLNNIGDLLELLADDANAQVDLTLIEDSEIVRNRVSLYLDGVGVLDAVNRVAIQQPSGLHARIYGDPIKLDLTGIDDVHGHVIGGKKWITGRARWNISYLMQFERLTSVLNPDMPNSKSTWTISFQIVSSLLFRQASGIEDVEVLSLGKPSHITSQLEELHD